MGALISGHPREAKKVSVTGACSLRGFVKVAMHKYKNCLLTRESITGECHEDSYFVLSCLLLFHVLPMRFLNVYCHLSTSIPLPEVIPSNPLSHPPSLPSTTPAPGIESMITVLSTFLDRRLQIFDHISWSPDYSMKSPG